MANQRVIRKRIRSVASTRKITKAMKMVAAARLRRAQQRVEQAKPYAKKLEALLQSLAGVPTTKEPLLHVRPVKNRLLIVLSSDRGLCGAFNSALFRRAEVELLGSDAAWQSLPIGRKATSYVARRKLAVAKTIPDFWATFNYANAAKLAMDATQGFIEGRYDRVDVLYNEFVSVITQRPVLVQLLPLALAKTESSETTRYLYEPDRQTIFERLLPRSLEVKFYLACLHSLASEYGARMTAMDSATRNAGEMIDRLTLVMNRARQAAITKELVEIISGAEALK